MTKYERARVLGTRALQIRCDFVRADVHKCLPAVRGPRARGVHCTRDWGKEARQVWAVRGGLTGDCAWW
jgi:hypothetical protein